MASITVRNLRKEYDKGTVVAVEGLDLDIKDGEFITVVGPSGCGKTTTLRMIAGLEPVTEGTIHIGDDDVTDLHAKNRDVAMVFQNYALYPHKTVFENMEFGLRMSTDLSPEERRDRVRNAAEMMGIESMLGDKPDQLSGGQKQRVALGRCIVREPGVFLFDEPLSNLDAKLRTSMRTEIQRLQDELGVTSVYVTHDQEEAMTMGDRIVILNEGELQQVGQPKEVYQNPINEFVGGFIGSPSMNFIDVEATAVGDGIQLSEINGPFQYKLSGEYAGDLNSSLSGQRFRLGIRPESVKPTQSAGDQTVTTTVEVVEPIGSDNYLHLDIGDDFIARVEADFEPEMGDQIEITFKEDHIHLFSPDNGLDVLATDEQKEKATVA